MGTFWRDLYSIKIGLCSCTPWLQGINIHGFHVYYVCKFLLLVFRKCKVCK